MTNISTTARRLLSRPPQATVAPSEYLLPRDAMRRLLEYERLRSTRSGVGFSFLTLQSPPRDHCLLARILQQRLRSTDLAGVVDDDQLGVFLPDTPEAGAWKVAEDTLALLPSDLPRPPCDVYVYPHPWWPGDRELADSHQDHGPPGGNGYGGGNGHVFGNGHVAHANGNGKLPSVPSAPQRCGARPLGQLLATPLPRWKRGLDILGAGAGLLALTPVIAVVAAIIKITSPGPVFFRQQREGLGESVFWMIKFRTMVPNADAIKAQFMSLNEQDGPAFKIDDDPRLTAIGRILRKTNIDELPQLWNVLRGEMSLVGPRPLPVDESRACEAWHRRRLDVTPGMTCLWQTQPRRNSILFADWMRMDLAYAGRRSLLGDLKLILATIRAITLRRGE